MIAQAEQPRYLCYCNCGYCVSVRQHIASCGSLGVSTSHLPRCANKHRHNCKRP